MEDDDILINRLQEQILDLKKYIKEKLNDR